MSASFRPNESLREFPRVLQSKGITPCACHSDGLCARFENAMRDGYQIPRKGTASEERRPNFKSDKYTAFDIWCAKASRETFRSIKNDAIFEKLLLRSRVFPDVYENKKSESIQNATRNMNPATDVHHAHWERFT